MSINAERTHGARDAYLAAWEEWSAPSDLAPAWTADRTTLARTDRAPGRADSGPRQMHGTDDTIGLVHAARAEMVDGLALTLAMQALVGFDPGRPAARRAFARIDRHESAYASTVALMGAATGAPASRASEDRWSPESVDVTDRARPVAYCDGQPINLEGPTGGAWRVFADRHGWRTGVASDCKTEGTTDDAGRALVRRAEKALREALDRIERSDFPEPTGGRPAAWIGAVRWLQASGHAECTGPAWLAARVAPPATDDRWSLAWERVSV